MNATQEWASMDGQQQYNALVAMAWTCKSRDGKYLDWITTQDDARTCAAEAWMEMAKENDKATEQGQPLAIALYRAVMTAGRRIDRQERRNARALHFEDLTNEDGETSRREYIELHSAPTAEFSWSDPYLTASIRDALERVCLDERDVAIIASIIRGLTGIETAAVCGISQPAVAKRLKKIAQRYAA